MSGPEGVHPPNEVLSASDALAQTSDQTLSPQIIENPTLHATEAAPSRSDSSRTTSENPKNDAAAQPQDTPTTPRAKESSSSLETQPTAPEAPAVTPISWKDAAQTKLESVEPKVQSFMDQAILDQLTVNAKQSSANLVVLVHHLRTQLSNISSLSVQYMQLHKSTVEGVSEHLHDAVASTQQMILKAQALNQELRRASQVHQDIKETKKLVTQLEKLVDKMVKS